MSWHISLALTLLVTALVYGSFQWGASHEKNNVTSAQNAALIEYVKAQKDITDKYEPVFKKLPVNANPDVIIDYAIDGLPDPRHTKSRLRPSTKADK